MSEFMIGYSTLNMTTINDSELTTADDLAAEIDGQYNGIVLGFKLGFEFMRFFRIFGDLKYTDMDCKDDCYYMSLRKYDVDFSATAALYTPMFNVTVGGNIGIGFGTFDGPAVTNNVSGTKYGFYLGLEKMTNRFVAMFIRVGYQNGQFSPKTAWMNNEDGTEYGKVDLEYGGAEILIGASNWDIF